MIKHIKFPPVKFAKPKLIHVGYAIAAVLVACLFSFTIKFFSVETFTSSDITRNTVHNISLAFLIACMFAAGRFGFVAGFIAAIFSFFIINYYFFAPYNSFLIESMAVKINLALFLMFTMLVAAYTSFQRTRLNILNIREKQVSDLYQMTTEATNAETRNETFEILESSISTILKGKATIHVPDPLTLRGMPKPDNLGKENEHLFDECWEKLEATGRLYRLAYISEWRFEPLFTPIGKVGVLAIQFDEELIITPDWNRLIKGIAAQTATILQRIELKNQMHETRIREEREKLRSLLLSSVSHDLKTPLASIIGSLSVYHSMFDRLNEEKRDILTRTALQEAQRLDSFISNILDMTRLESGAVKFRPEWFNVEYAINNVLNRMNERLNQHIVEKYLTPIEVYADKTLFEQIIQNLLDNAVKYTKKGSLIRICADLEKNEAVIKIYDNGKGIPEDQYEAIFDKYSRLKREDSQEAGTGLGLAIAKIVMERQEGRIAVNGNPDGGAVFSLYFPKAKAFLNQPNSQEVSDGN